MQICPARRLWQTLVKEFLFVSLLPFCSRQNYANICQGHGDAVGVGDGDGDAMPMLMPSRHVNFPTTTNEDQRWLIYFIFMYPRKNTSVFPCARPCNCNCKCNNRRLIQRQSLSQVHLARLANTWPEKLSGLANTFFAPQKCWRRFVVHLETWGRPSAAGCWMLDAVAVEAKAEVKVAAAKADLAAATKRLRHTSDCRFCLPWLPFVAFWRLAVVVVDCGILIDFFWLLAAAAASASAAANIW